MAGHNIQFVKYVSSKKALYRTPSDLKIKKISKLPDELNAQELGLYKGCYVQ